MRVDGSVPCAILHVFDADENEDAGFEVVSAGEHIYQVFVGDVFFDLGKTLFHSSFDGFVGGVGGDVFGFDDPGEPSSFAMASQTEQEIAIALVEFFFGHQVKSFGLSDISEEHELHGLLVEFEQFAQAESFDHLVVKGVDEGLNIPAEGHRA